MMIRAWIKMISAILLIWGFVTIFPLILNKLKMYRAITENSEEMGIDNSALFYTEEKQTSVAEAKLRKQLARENIK